MTRTPLLARPLSDRKLRGAIFVVVLLILVAQWVWIATLSELYGLLSGASVGLNEVAVRSLLGEPASVVTNGTPHILGFYPVPSEKAQRGGKVIIYQRYRYCAYVYVDRTGRVTATFIARRF